MRALATVRTISLTVVLAQNLFISQETAHLSCTAYTPDTCKRQIVMQLMHCTCPCGVSSTASTHSTHVRSTLMQPRTCVQDSSFKNVNAINLFWTLSGAVVVAEGTKYSNVTTESARWDVAGSHVGSGDDVNIVLPYGQSLEQPSARGSLPSSVIQPLSMTDSWIESVRQVLSHPLHTTS